MEKRLAMDADVRKTRSQVKLRLVAKSRISFEKVEKISCATSSGRFNTQQVARRERTKLKQKTNNNTMAKALSKSQVAAAIAEKNGITKRQAVEILETISD